MRIATLVLLCALPLWADDTVRTEFEYQSNPGVKDPGASLFWFYSHRPKPKSRFAYGANLRYFKLNTIDRWELTASGSAYFKRGLINLNLGSTTEPRFMFPAVTRWDLGAGCSGTGLADTKLGNARLPTTVYSKGYVGCGPLYFRLDNFHVGGNNVYTYIGAEGRWKFKTHYELFGAPQISVVGPKKLVIQGGLRTNFNIHFHK